MVSPTGEAYVGVIKSLHGQHGFISCEITHEVYGQDVFTSMANTGSLGVGSLICFELVLNGKGQPQARHCRMVESDPLGATGCPSAKQEPIGKAYNGRIKFVAERHSFIECEEVKASWGNDVFCSISMQDNAVHGGEMVNFELMRNSQGKPQAFNVRLIGEGTLGSAEVAAANARGYQNGKGAVYHSTESFGCLAGTDLKVSARIPVGGIGESYIGFVKTIDSIVGLISCDQVKIAHRIDRNVSVSASLLEGFEIGSLVNFDLTFNNGLPLGCTTRAVLSSPSEAPPSSKQTPTGKCYNGIIKEMRELHGFIECKIVQSMFEGYDTFFSSSSAVGLDVGDMVNFELMVSDKGRPQAVKLAKVDPHGVSSDSDPTETLTDAQVHVVKPEMESKSYVGTIKSINGKFCFITSPEIVQEFGRDVFCSTVNLTGQGVGHEVSFNIVLNSRGHPQARNVQNVSDDHSTPSDNIVEGIQSEAHELEQDWGVTAVSGLGTASCEQHVGKIKSFGGKFCFITSPEIVAQFGRDVFCSTLNLDGQVVGDEVAFDIVLNDRGHPQARNVRSSSKDHMAPNHSPIIERAAPQGTQAEFDAYEFEHLLSLTASHAGETHSGKIKSINDKFCFISSPEISKQFGRDVFCSTVNLAGQVVGQEVLFDVILNDRGQPQARNIRNVGGAGRSCEPSSESYRGKIKSINETFCFISSPEIVDQFGRDVFCSTVNLSGQVVGQDVLFDIVLNSRGQPQARNVKSCGQWDHSGPAAKRQKLIWE